MIKPDDIKKQALQWWKLLLQSHIHDIPFFPKQIDRIGKVKPGEVTHQFAALQRDVEQLFLRSKNHTGTGYLVTTAGHNFKRAGSHQMPDTIVFETLTDYLSFTGKQKEWNLFLSNYTMIISAMPFLKEWASEHCLRLTDKSVNWSDVLKVCEYFRYTPRPQLYLRQLPVQIHTKFIEENTALIQSLLDFLIPGHIRSAGNKRFAERFYLRHDEPLIRMRFLDLQTEPQQRFADISIPLSDFETFEPSSVYILIAENKMNFLTLPLLPSTTAIWSGGGFNISYLKKAAWLLNKIILYWGDIDEHGLQILHQLRSYYPATISVMMDRITFDRFRIYTTDGTRSPGEHLSLLTSEENELFQYLKTLEKNNRLEQEKIPQDYADDCLRKCMISVGRK